MRCGSGALCCNSGVPVLAGGRYSCSGAETRVAYEDPCTINIYDPACLTSNTNSLAARVLPGSTADDFVLYGFALVGLVAVVGGVWKALQKGDHFETQIEV